MMVAAMVAIIATLAYPAYLDSLRAARRTEAKTSLLTAANRQQRYYATTSPNRFAASMTALGYAADPASSGPGTHGWYSVSVLEEKAAAAALGTPCPIQSCFVLQAVPRRDQGNDSECAILRLDSLGRRYASGSGAAADCW